MWWDKQNIARQKYYNRKQIANADCKQFDEMVERIISACIVVATEQHIKRHVRVCAELHCNICRETGGNETVHTGVAMYRKWYKEVMKVR